MKAIMLAKFLALSSLALAAPSSERSDASISDLTQKLSIIDFSNFFYDGDSYYVCLKILNKGYHLWDINTGNFISSSGPKCNSNVKNIKIINTLVGPHIFDNMTPPNVLAGLKGDLSQSVGRYSNAKSITRENDNTSDQCPLNISPYFHIVYNSGIKYDFLIAVSLPHERKITMSTKCIDDNSESASVLQRYDLVSDISSIPIGSDKTLIEFSDGLNHPIFLIVSNLPRTIWKGKGVYIINRFLIAPALESNQDWTRSTLLNRYNALKSAIQ